MLAERVAHDLRTVIVKSPGSRSLKIGTLLAFGSVVGRYSNSAQFAYQLSNRACDLYLLFTNTFAGLARIAKGHNVDSTIDLGQQWLRSFGTRLIIFKIGRATIDLYSGKLRLSDEELAEAAEADASAARRIAATPPRLLVAGQVNAGKSSLMNALADGVLCEVRSTPVRATGVEHVLKVDGQDAAIIVEAPGLTSSGDAKTATITAAQNCDMIVWVTSATQPGRAADVETLAALRKIYEGDMANRPPPILVALTHVDQLPPAAEWTPPYNTMEPANPKEKVMRRAMESVAKALEIDFVSIVPVALVPGADPWNTEFLWGYIAANLDEAKYHQITRLRLVRGEGSWSELAGQAARLMGDAAGVAGGLAAQFVKNAIRH